MKHLFSSFIATSADRNKKILSGLILVLVLSAAGFSFHNQSVRWFWTDQPWVGILLILAAIYSARIWIHLDRLPRLPGSGSKDRMRSELSGRERIILDLILSGKSNKEIAENLFIEVSTVKTHINNLNKTLGTRSREEIRSRFGSAHDWGGEKIPPPVSTQNPPPGGSTAFLFWRKLANHQNERRFVMTALKNLKYGSFLFLILVPVSFSFSDSRLEFTTDYAEWISLLSLILAGLIYWINRETLHPKWILAGGLLLFFLPFSVYSHKGAIIPILLTSHPATVGLYWLLSAEMLFTYYRHRKEVSQP